MSDEAAVKSIHNAQGRRYHFDLVRNGAVVRDPGGLILRGKRRRVTTFRLMS